MQPSAQTRWRDPRHPGRLRALIALALAAAMAATVLLTSLAVSGTPSVSRLMEIVLDKSGLAKLLTLLPPSVLAWLQWPADDALLSKQLSRMPAMQFLAVLLLSAPFMWRWAAGRITFHLLSLPDATVLRPLPKATGIMPWVMPESPDLRAALQHLQAWLSAQDKAAGPSRWWRPWARPRLAPVLSVRMVLGPNGIGKTQTVLELAKRTGAGGRWDVGELMPGHAVAPAHGIDPAVPGRSSPLALQALRSWRPRKPTLMVLDEPGIGVTQTVLDALAEQASQYWYPVCLLVVDQVLPADCLAYMLGQAEAAPGAALADRAVHRLGDVRLTLSDVLHISTSYQRLLHPGPTAMPNLKTNEDLWRFMQLTGGEPLVVALGIAELGAHPAMSVSGWAAASAPHQVESGLQALPAEQLRHRVIEARAHDLIDAWNGAQPTTDATALLIDAVAAASLVGGLSLSGPMQAHVASANIDPRDLAQRFPDALQRGLLPGFGMPIVQDAALAAWLQRSIAPAHRAQRIVDLAWAESPARAARAGLRRPGLPPVLRQCLLDRLAATPPSAELLVEWMRAAAQDLVPLATCRAAITRLPADQWAAAWSLATSVLHLPDSRPLHPVKSLLLLADVAARMPASAGAHPGPQIGPLELVRALGAVQARVGAWSLWLPPWPQEIAAAWTAVLRPWMAQGADTGNDAALLEALQTDLVDPLLCGPVDLATARFLWDLAHWADPDGTTPLRPLWRLMALAGRAPSEVLFDDFLMVCAEPALAGWETRQPRQLMVVRASCALLCTRELTLMPANHAAALEQRMLSAARQVLPALHADLQRMLLRWCQAALSPGLRSAPIRAAHARLAALFTELGAGLPQSVTQPPPWLDLLAEATREALQQGAPFSLLDGVVALQDTQAQWLHTVQTRAIGAEDASLRAASWSLDSWARYGALLNAGQTGTWREALAATTGAEDRLGWASAAFADHVDVVLARLYTGYMLLKALAPDLRQLQEAEVHQACASLLHLARHAAAETAPLRLQRAALAFLSESVGAAARQPQIAQAQTTSLGRAREVSALSRHPLLSDFPESAYREVIAWDHVLQGMVERSLPPDGLEGLTLTRIDTPLLADVQAVYLRDFTPALARFPAQPLVGQRMAARAAAAVVAVAALQADTQAAVHDAVQAFAQHLAPLLHGHADEDLFEIEVIAANNVLVAVRHSACTAAQLALARSFFERHVHPVLMRPGLSPALGVRCLAAWSVWLELLAMEQAGASAQFEAAVQACLQMESFLASAGAGLRADAGASGALAMAWSKALERAKKMYASHDVALPHYERMCQFVQRWIEPRARHPQQASAIWTQAACAQAWCSCAFVAHQLNRAELVGACAEKVAACLARDPSLQHHPMLNAAWAQVLDYHASTLFRTHARDAGQQLLAHQLRPLALAWPEHTDIQLCYLEALEKSLQMLTAGDDAEAQDLLAHIASQVEGLASASLQAPLRAPVLQQCLAHAALIWPEGPPASVAPTLARLASALEQSL